MSSAPHSLSASRGGITRMFRRFRGSGVGTAISRGALGAFGVNLAGAAGTFGLHVLLSRLIGGVEYGIYIYVVTWVTVLALVARLGLDTALVRYLPAYTVRSEWALLYGILQRSAVFVLAGGVVVAASMAAGTWYLGQRLDPGLAATLWIGSFLVPVIALVLLAQSALRGFGKVPLAEVPDRLMRPLLMAVTVGAAYIGFGWRLTAQSTIAVHLAVMVVALVAAVWWLKRALPEPAKAAAPMYRDREWLSTSFPLIILTATHLVLGQIDVLMVGSILGTTEAGIYAVAGRIAVLVSFSLLAINVIAGPMISQLFARERMVALQRIVTLTARWNLVFSLAVAAAILVFGTQLLLLFGSEFTAGYTALAILTVGQLFNALAGSVALLMTMTGHQRNAAAIMVASVLVNIALNAVLIPLFGLPGAAAATAVTTAMWNLIMLRYVRRRLGVRASAVPGPW